MRRTCILAVLLCAGACGAKNDSAAGGPQEPEGAKPGHTPQELRPPDPAPELDATPTAEPEAIATPDATPAAEATPKPEPKPKKKRACKADEHHCCLADGKIVKPGGCQPMYPDDVRAATVRGDGGWCEPIACNMRCLPATARIATPRGDVPVTELHAGDTVWTVDATGERVAQPIRRIAASPVPSTHELVELTLVDGRRVRASAGHPTADGGALGMLRDGDRLDGSTVVSRRTIAYDGDHTWDLLPAGDTGAYWADGVLLGSTLE